MDDTTLEITVNGNAVSLERFRLKRWLELELAKDKIFEEAEHGNVDEFSDYLCSYVSLSSDVEIDNTVFWGDVAIAFFEIASFQIPTEEHLILSATKEEDVERSWDYDGRTWYSWSHTLAKEYGWNMEYIAELDIDDAIAMLQEIAVEDQLEREWEWTRTELAYPYNESTKKHMFSPLPRPEWMKEKVIIKPLKTTKIPKFMMPVGNVIRAKTIDEEIIN